jgi:SAM-dependent MidA family methyltransferase
MQDLSALAHAEKVSDAIREEIQKKGPISFSRFMEMALYAPGLGYYCVGTEKIGPRGDFVTAPEISPLFALCVADYCDQVLKSFDSKTILEMGAGTGRLAVGILAELAKRNSLPEKYYILDLSPELKQRQKDFIQENSPQWIDRVEWLTELPKQPFEGVIIANEVLDAMPVTLFQQTEEGLKERVVSLSEQNQFTWELREASEELSKEIEALEIDFPLNYYSEINRHVAPWIQSMSHALDRGEILLIDYGFLRSEYYHPQRATGTLMCHYQQRAHSDPLILTGIQDITAHVDFTAVGNAAQNSGLEVKEYSTQAQFLLNHHLLEFMQSQAITPEEQFAFANQVKMLTLPSEMGELFKVMILKRV